VEEALGLSEVIEFNGEGVGGGEQFVAGHQEGLRLALGGPPVEDGGELGEEGAGGVSDEEEEVEIGEARVEFVPSG
jgi:hypothetical protein